MNRKEINQSASAARAQESPASEGPRSPSEGRTSRRGFLIAAASTAVAPAVATARPISPLAPQEESTSSYYPIELRINGQPYSLSLDARTSLLDALREHIGLTGTKKGCDQGQCGACTVMVENRRVLSCLTLAASVVSRSVTTVEGLIGLDGSLHPMQQAFIDNDAFQCGFCTPGQIISAIACVHEGHARSEREIREYMSGNLCRCAAYPNIVAAVSQGKSAMEPGSKG